MKIIIAREPDYRNQEYCILEFKGKFETEELPTKCMVHLGSLNKIDDDTFRFQIGVMDLIGKAIKLQQGWLYTQTEDGEVFNSKIIRVRGIITTKILFDKRPCPDMERSQIEPKTTQNNNIFKKTQRN